MKKITGLVLIAGALLSGCSLSGHSVPAAATTLKGVYSDNSSQYGYIKSFPRPAGGVLSPDKLRQCVLTSHTAQNVVPAGEGFTGQTTYSVNRMGSPVPFVVSFSLQVSETDSERQYTFSQITQAPENDRTATTADWVTANPEQVVGTFNNVSAEINRCLSHPV